MPKLLQINSVVNTGSTGRIVEQLGQLAMANGWESHIAFGREARKSRTKLIRIGSKASCSLNNPDLETLDSMCVKIDYLLTHPQDCKQMQENAANGMKQIWSPAVAASRFLTLIENLKNDKEVHFMSGPCSKA